MKTPSTLAAIPLLATLAHLAASHEPVPAKNLAKGRTILFVDDHDILYRSGTKRVGR